MLKIIIREGGYKWEMERHMSHESIMAIRIGESVKLGWRTETELNINPGNFRIVDKIHDLETGQVSIEVKRQ